jgi:peptide deformylase
LQVITYPHPTLRYRSKNLMRVDADLKRIVAEMFDKMYEHHGVGLAANQVDLPLRLFIANPGGAPGEGEEMVFINPVLSRGRGIEESEEGCLSLPGLHGNVRRNKSIHVSAYTLEGTEINQVFDGFVARILQHETDHLDGVLFIDRLGPGVIKSLENDLSAFEIDFRSKQKTGSLASDGELVQALGSWEQRYC